MHKSKAEAVSLGRTAYLKAVARQKHLLIGTRCLLFILFIILWEVAATLGWIDAFITSSPSGVYRVLQRLIPSGELWFHLSITLKEVLFGFIFGSLVGTLIAMVLWLSPFWSKVLEPYLVVIHALPKIALGPLFIVWLGAGELAIIGVTLSISMIVTILEVLNGFVGTSPELIRLTQSLGASRWAIFRKVVLPSNIPTLLSALKVSVGMSWVGVIVGEFLVSRGGIGYLIVYGSQVFQLDLVMTGVVVLGISATLMYLCVAYIEKELTGGTDA